VVVVDAMSMVCGGIDCDGGGESYRSSCFTASRSDAATRGRDAAAMHACGYLCPSCLTVIVVVAMTRADAAERRHWQ
jgi:hypothetical protein